MLIWIFEEIDPVPLSLVIGTLSNVLKTFDLYSNIGRNCFVLNMKQYKKINLFHLQNADLFKKCTIVSYVLNLLHMHIKLF